MSVNKLLLIVCGVSIRSSICGVLCAEYGPPHSAPPIVATSMSRGNDADEARHCVNHISAESLPENRIGSSLTRFWFIERRDSCALTISNRSTRWWCRRTGLASRPSRMIFECYQRFAKSLFHSSSLSPVARLLLLRQVFFEQHRSENRRRACSKRLFCVACRNLSVNVKARRRGASQSRSFRSIRCLGDKAASERSVGQGTKGSLPG